MKREKNSSNNIDEIDVIKNLNRILIKTHLPTVQSYDSEKWIPLEKQTNETNAQQRLSGNNRASTETRELSR